MIFLVQSTFWPLIFIWQILNQIVVLLNVSLIFQLQDYRSSQLELIEIGIEYMSSLIFLMKK